jgi:hypothetical protein
MLNPCHEFLTFPDDVANTSQATSDSGNISMLEIISSLLKVLAKWKPDWLYELMPYIYTLAGIAAIFHFDTVAWFGAGILLLLAAALIWKMRKDHRSFRNTAH